MEDERRKKDGGRWGFKAVTQVLKQCCGVKVNIYKLHKTIQFIYRTKCLISINNMKSNHN